MLLTTQLSRWALLLWTTLSTHGGDFLGTPKRRLIWAFPFVAFLHPAFLLLSAALVGGWTLLNSEPTPFEWGLIVGVGFYVLPMFMMILVILKRRKKAANSHERI